jgi:hypothetical protein
MIFCTSLTGYYFRNVTIIIHSNVYTFYITVNLYKTAGLFPLLDEDCKKLVSLLLCCWYKDHANLDGSVIT